ncbi:DinB family protein [Halomonas saccharevitans]|uniref:DinB superfamily protein n=1 Tax=Halomonas saccharevitans TaxID=416872 RepID=A0A1I6XNI8_9GAMM|nr:DinB family protein [Halomonas saccharevitans]SFT39716.1 DinB superfamily protein [Halomonas saccharevitans]
MPIPATLPSRTAPGLIEENRMALAQLNSLLDDLAPEAYRRVFGVHGRHTLGKHVRHIIDHYEALIDGLEAGAETLDYEQRRRDPALEARPDEAARRLAALDTWLSSLQGQASPERLTLRHCQDADAPASDRVADDEARLALPSSLARELAFLASHTVHHMAIIGLLAEQIGIALPASFGVHPSTLRHWQREAATAPGAPSPSSAMLPSWSAP